jgi:hypothetical protein
MGLAAIVAFGAVSAASASGGPTFSVSYRAVEGCPTQATFEAAILVRAPRAEKSAAGADAQVQIEADLNTAPRLRVSTRDGTSQDREIVAEGCTEAMQSMAIIAAMILEAQPARSAPVAAEPSPVAPASPRDDSARPATSTPASPRDEPARPATSTPRRRLVAAVSVAADAESAVAPALAFGVAAGAELGSSAPGLVSPSVRLSLVLAQAARVETLAGDARFRLVLGRAHLCGLKLAAARSSLRVCALVEAGALLGEGIDARNRREQTMPWLGTGLAALGAFDLAGPVALELGAGARALLVKDRFVFLPDENVHQVPDVAWNLSMGLRCALF